MWQASSPSPSSRSSSSARHASWYTAPGSASSHVSSPRRPRLCVGCAAAQWRLVSRADQLDDGARSRETTGSADAGIMLNDLSMQQSLTVKTRLLSNDVAGGTKEPNPEVGGARVGLDAKHFLSLFLSPRLPPLIMVVHHIGTSAPPASLLLSLTSMHPAPQSFSSSSRPSPNPSETPSSLCVKKVLPKSPTAPQTPWDHRFTMRR